MPVGSICTYLTRSYEIKAALNGVLLCVGSTRSEGRVKWSCPPAPPSLNSVGMAEFTRGRFPGLLRQLLFKFTFFFAGSRAPRPFQARTSQILLFLTYCDCPTALIMCIGLCLSPLSGFFLPGLGWQKLCSIYHC